ncbi:short-chain dehydrogenase [Lophiotrema nucula]|uniref:Short-chain dehydrogenase n=1 Tax=Lophiotrema nucula TaxID=690887 RepID=A0A6A5ZNX1_9PLEO|nr:short-chain dehydrogenase [Lophiotrema nucula]
MARKEKWDFSVLPNLTGKVALVTGANSQVGIGWHVAHQLALKGAKVYIGARSLQKAESAINEILAESPSISKDQLQPFVADLGNFKQVQKAAKDFLSSEERLDILVNNAGVLARPLDFDEHGTSVSISTNHLGPFLLTTTLIPILEKTAKINPDVRIVNVSSTAHFDAPQTARFATLDDLNQSFGHTDDSMSNYIRYGYSKAANVLFTISLQRLFDSRSVPIIATSLHPGGVATNGAAEYQGGWDKADFSKAFTPAEGAITPLYAAAHPEVREQADKYRGAFLLPWGGIKTPSTLVERAPELWEISEKLLKEALEQ